MKKETWYYILAGIALLVAVIIGVNASSDDVTDTLEVNEEVVTLDVTTTIQVDDQITEYPQNVNESTTALDALQLLQENGEVIVETTEYDFGAIVDSIDTIGEDTTDNKYWIYYINDETAQVGASEYILIDGDQIRWNYEDSI